MPSATASQQPRVPKVDRGRGVPAVRVAAAALRDQQGDHVDRHDDHRHGEAEQNDQLDGLPPGVVLTFEEIHGHGHARSPLRGIAVGSWDDARLAVSQPKETFGASRCSACSISNRLAAWKLNMPAMITVGNISRWVL